jgi:hypothetical protein
MNKFTTIIIALALSSCISGQPAFAQQENQKCTSPEQELSDFAAYLDKTGYKGFSLGEKSGVQTIEGLAFDYVRIYEVDFLDGDTDFPILFFKSGCLVHQITLNSEAELLQAMKTLGMHQ